MTTNSLPDIDRNRCEGKKACVDACPNTVLQIRRLTSEEFSALGFRGKIKALAHGRRQAWIADPDACNACGICVTVCPENAISLGG